MEITVYRRMQNKFVGFDEHLRALREKGKDAKLARIVSSFDFPSDCHPFFSYFVTHIFMFDIS